MRTIQTEPLTHETFAPFGNFYVMTKPDGYSLNGEIHRFSLTESANLMEPEWDFRRFW